MRRIHPPVCTICDKRNAEYESDVWPSLRLCGICRRDAIESVIQIGFIHGNPLLIELAQPGDNGNRDDAIRIWRSRPGMSSTYNEFFIRYQSDDSYFSVDNSLDFSDLL